MLMATCAAIGGSVAAIAAADQVRVGTLVVTANGGFTPQLDRKSVV